MDPVAFGINIPGTAALVLSGIILLLQTAVPIAIFILLWMIWRELKNRP